MSTEPGSDPIGDFQRWLMKAGARSIGRDVADRVKSTVGGNANKNADVWETATTEDPDEPPECQWCPICRAARRYREGGGTGADIGGQVQGVSDALTGLTRDAFSLFDAALRATSGTASGARRATTRPAAQESATTADSGTADTSAADNSAGDISPAADQRYPENRSDDGTVVGPGVGWPSVVHPQHEDHEAADEGSDREESAEAGDGLAESGADEQVERPAE
jgi:hypothetical protein